MRPIAAATRTPAFIAPSRFRSEQAAEGAHHERHKARALQALVVDAETASVLRKTDIHQLEDVDVIGQLACPGHGEIVVLHAVGNISRDADAFPDKERPDGENFQLEPWTTPQRHIAPM